MSTILIAHAAEGGGSLERILRGHNLTFVTEMRDAQIELVANTFDMIVATLHFDESQMFELLREIRRNPKSAATPIICFCSRDTEMARVMHESLEVTTRALGAWMYLSEHAYNEFQKPDDEIRRVMEQCLTEDARQENLQLRIDIQKQRKEIQHVRMLLKDQIWSPKMEEYIVTLKSELELLLEQVTTLQTSATGRRATVSTSRKFNDRVADHVTSKENDMTDQEEKQSLQETKQSAAEHALKQSEDTKQFNGQRDRKKVQSAKEAQTNSLANLD